jgi:iron complex outermembrane receptor protein
LAIGALMLPEAAWGQVAETLPEVTVTAPRPAPVRRPTQAATRARSAPSTRVSAPAAPAPQIPAFQVVATTPVTGLGFDRDKVPAMVQTLPAEDFSRVYSPNVTQTLEQRVPGVFISDVQGNEFTSDLRYRGFTASPLQGTPQGLAVYMQGIRVNEAFGDTVNWDLSFPKIRSAHSDGAVRKELAW